MAGPGEFEIIRDFFAVAKKGEGVVLGIGDDCALLQAPSRGLLATSVDTLVAGVHFPQQAPPALVAARALRVNLSDLAAMNAQPLWFTLALTLPESDTTWLREFARGLLETAETFGVSLVGGDTTRGPLSITIQVSGSCISPLRRDGAKPGDAIFVSGELGAAAAALPVILGQQRVSEALRREAERAYYLPQPQLALAAEIGELAGSAIDISDGLLADLAHICRASNVSAELQMEALPVAALAHELAADSALQLAASGGDDYQLCFTVPEKHCSALQSLDLPIVRIGTLVEAGNQAEVRCWLNGESWQPDQLGYQHF
jgi:thiamine-monophosphate kinase